MHSPPRHLSSSAMSISSNLKKRTAPLPPQGTANSSASCVTTSVVNIYGTLPHGTQYQNHHVQQQQNQPSQTGGQIAGYHTIAGHRRTPSADASSRGAMLGKNVVTCNMCGNTFEIYLPTYIFSAGAKQVLPIDVPIGLLKGLDKSQSQSSSVLRPRMPPPPTPHGSSDTRSLSNGRSTESISSMCSEPAMKKVN